VELSSQWIYWDLVGFRITQCCFRFGPCDLWFSTLTIVVALTRAGFKASARRLYVCLL
jgi:hypothetical protein